MGRKLGALSPSLGRGAGSRYSTMWPGPRPTFHAKCHLDPSSRWATIDMGRKLGRVALAPFWGGKAWSRSNKPFGHNRNGPKLGSGAPPPFWGRGAGSPSSTMQPGPRPTFVPNALLIHLDVWPQWTWAENWGGVSAPLFGKGSWVPI